MPEPRGTNTADLIGGALVVFLGAAWVWMARDLGLIGEGGRVEAGTLPALAGGVLAACGLAIVASGLRGRGTGSPAGGAPEETDRGPTGAEPQAQRNLRIPKAGIVFVALLVCLAAAPVLSFALAFAIFVFVVTRVIEGKSLVLSAAAALGIWAVAFVGFELLLSVPLPQASLFG